MDEDQDDHCECGDCDALAQERYIAHRAQVQAQQEAPAQDQSPPDQQLQLHVAVPQPVLDMEDYEDILNQWGVRFTFDLRKYPFDSRSVDFQKKTITVHGG